MKWHLSLLVPHQNPRLRGERRGEKVAKGLFFPLSPSFPFDARPACEQARA